MPESHSNANSMSNPISHSNSHSISNSNSLYLVLSLTLFLSLTLSLILASILIFSCWSANSRSGSDLISNEFPPPPLFHPSDVWGGRRRRSLWVEPTRWVQTSSWSTSPRQHPRVSPSYYSITIPPTPLPSIPYNQLLLYMVLESVILSAHLSPDHYRYAILWHHKVIIVSYPNYSCLVSIIDPTYIVSLHACIHCIIIHMPCTRHM